MRRLEDDYFHGLGLHLDQHPTDVEVAFAHWAHHFKYAVHTQHDLLYYPKKPKHQASKVAEKFYLLLGLPCKITTGKYILYKVTSHIFETIASI